MTPDAIIPTYQRYAARFDALRDRGLFERPWLDAFAALVPPGGAVLDLGCGMAEPIAAHLIAQGFQLTGLDSAPGMIALCRARFPAHRWLVGDMRAPPLTAGFDGIIAWNSFFHLTAEDQRAMFRHFAALAAPGAALLFTSGPRAGTAIGALEPGVPLFHASLDPEEYRALLAAQGFAVVRHIAEDPDCNRHTVWLARLT
jgi:SAM-dependent methyltransferase